MAKILAQGGRLDSVVVTGGSVLEENAGSFDATYADCALFCNDNTGAAHFELSFIDNAGAAVDLANGETGFFHFEYRDGGTSGSVGNIWELYDSSSFPWLALRQDGSSGGQVLRLMYNSNTGASPVWTQLGGTQTYADASRHEQDVKITINSGGNHAVQWSVDRAAVVTATFANAGFGSARKCRYIGRETSRFSQLLCTEGLTTIGAKVKYSRPTGAGTTNTFSSAAAANVNEVVNSDASFDQSAAAGQKVTYAMGDVAVPAGYRIGGVDHCIRGKNDGSAPTNLKSVIRSGGVDYASGNLPGIGTSFGSLRRRIPTDPATGVDFTQAGWNAAEAGYESAA